MLSDRSMVSGLLILNTDPYHVPVIRNQLTKNLGVLFPWLRDEVVQAFHENIPPATGKWVRHWFALEFILSSDWTKVRAYDITLQIVSQTANRLFVGDSLCEYILFIQSCPFLMLGCRSESRLVGFEYRVHDRCNKSGNCYQHVP
jgi:hypothetical protein